MRLVQVVVFDNRGNQTFEVVSLSGKGAGDFASQKVNAVVKADADAGEDDFRTELRRDGQIVPGEPQLAEQAGERAALGALRGEIGQRVQADVVIAPAEAVKGIEAADR